MTDVSIISSVLGLGVGGVLGVIIFLMYRHDRNNTEVRWSDATKDLIECRKEENETRERHTAVLSELTTLLKKMNGRGGG